MKKKIQWMGWSALLMLSVCWGQPHADRHYALSGDASAVTQAGTVVIRRRGAMPSIVEEFARAPIKAGKFKLEGEVDWVDEAHVTVVGPGKDEKILAEFRIIFEPGDTRVTLLRNPSRVEIGGGPYYRRAIESWERNPRYLAAMQSVQDVLEKLRKSPQEQKSLSAEANSKLAQATRIKNELLDQMIASHAQDPLLRYLVEQNRQTDFTARLTTLSALQRELPSHIGLTRLIAETRDSQTRSATADSIKEGTVFRDFAAPDLEGREVRLSEILKRQKYVLVDFWASWCGLCRLEIPYMKRAYEKFHPGGFEIVAFSVDESKPAWRKASVAEKMPWINISDLQAFNGPVATMFGVASVPANYLIDAQGKVVAINLRGEELQKKLTELL